jgi:hypothetical protein
MYAVPDGGIVQVIFEGFILNQQMLTVLHYQLENPGGVADGGLALDALKVQLVGAGSLHEKYLLAISQNYSQGRIRLQWILPDRFAYREYIPPNTEGQAPTDTISPNAAVAINKKSDLAGVHGHGVTHMPGVPMDSVSAGKVNVAGLLLYADVGTKMKADLVTLGSGTYHPIIFNRKTPGEISKITSFTVDDKIRTMHRRTVGLGS